MTDESLKPDRISLAVAALSELQNENGDIEVQHSMADAILCGLLKALGYDDVVEAWAKVPKWYA